MRIDVVTLFPDFFASPLSTGLLGKAIEVGLANVDYVDPRNYTEDRHRTVDDTPYGGGAGMVMKAPQVVSAIEEAKAKGDGPVLMLSPQGRPLTHAKLEAWSSLPHLVLVCGRYEGFDERIRTYVDEEVSIGDFVLTGGEYGALVLIDGIVRLLPGTVGNQASTLGDSFSDGLLEHPHYTRPEVFRGLEVPSILKSGDHAKIAAWRHRASLQKTKIRRPDILMQRMNSAEDRDALRTIETAAPKLNLVLACPDSASLIFEMDQLWGLATAYELQGLYLLVQNQESKLALEAWREERRGRFCPVVERTGSRKQHKLDQAAMKAAYDLQQATLDRLCFVEDLTDLNKAYCVSELTEILVYDPQNTEGLVHRSFREIGESHDQTHFFIHIGVWPDQARGFIGAARKHSSYSYLSDISACALLLDRILGEA